MGLFSSEIESLIVEATSEYLPAAQEDLGKNLEICDLIKSRQVPSKTAMRALKDRLHHRNPNVQLLALSVRPLISLAKKSRDLLQQWAQLLGGEEGLQYMRAAYEQSKREGIEYPPAPRAIPASIVTTEAPPEWTDSAVCVRCNVQFGIMLRKHHCRRCGKTFCQDCSGKEIALPELGLYDEVRVCESCFADKFTERTSTRGSKDNIPQPGSANPPDGTYEDDMEKAIRLSLQETQLPRPVAAARPKEDAYDEDAALAAAIAASLQETRPEVRNEIRTEIRNGSQNESRDETHPSSPAIYSTVPNSAPSYAPIQPPVTPVMLITPIERENVQLFSELLNRMGPQDEELGEPQFLQLANNMIQLRDRLQAALSRADCPADVSRITSILDTALLIYERLSAESYSPPNLATLPTAPHSETGSITYVDTSKPSAPLAQPPPAEVVPVLRPLPMRRKEEDVMLIPDLDVEDMPQPEPREDPLAELVDDAPLIQL
ncbi:ENTH/VHS domain-containing protein [Paramicrosporidium saccamoebae]|uniref:Vacuolar protein sorting-associated protein 27 n=1 Tax=Paramicrosporidium saccamoebae TaxID=1246581 RepID=A0A2H9TMR0_9FUNG|nr:ENTH/VHS domain-containing protein [Paramicrosporidium saccamoebae]